VIRASSGKTARRLLLGAGVLAVLVPTLAGCEAGNSAPTLEYHSSNAGTDVTYNGIQISDAFVLGAPDGTTVPSGSSASLFMSLYNNGTAADTLQSATAAGSASSVALSGGTVPLPLYGSADLSGPKPKVALTGLTKPLAAGSTVKVTLTFEHAGSVTISVPVEAQAYYWATYSAPASPSASSSASPSASGGSSSSATASPSASASS
jgi:copper(I)-binding protein